MKMCCSMDIILSIAAIYVCMCDMELLDGNCSHSCTYEVELLNSNMLQPHMYIIYQGFILLTHILYLPDNVSYVLHILLYTVYIVLNHIYSACFFPDTSLYVAFLTSSNLYTIIQNIRCYKMVFIQSLVHLNDPTCSYWS